ncbi:hypothetical protein ACOME3_005624 [Neoechinorhynchus agilis]
MQFFSIGNRFTNIFAFPRHAEINAIISRALGSIMCPASWSQIISAARHVADAKYGTQHASIRWQAAGAGAAATRAEERWTVKYHELASQFLFLPFGVETGIWKGRSGIRD